MLYVLNYKRKTEFTYIISYADIINEGHIYILTERDILYSRRTASAMIKVETQKEYQLLKR